MLESEIYWYDKTYNFDVEKQFQQLYSWSTKSCWVNDYYFVHLIEESKKKKNIYI